MREPTEEILDQETAEGDFAIKAGWQAMIDAALERK